MRIKAAMTTHPLFRLAFVSTLAAFGLLMSAIAALIMVRPTGIDILLGLSSMILLVATAVALIQRRPLLDPVYVSIFTFFLLFLLRPMYDNANSTFSWLTIDVNDVMPQVLLAILALEVAFFIGYFHPAGRLVARNLPNPPPDLYPSTTLVFALTILGMALVLKLSSAMLSGGLATLVQRREAYSATATNIPFVTEGAMVAVAALLIFLYLRPKYPVISALGTLLSGAVILQSAVGGNRRQVIILFATVVVYFALKQAYKPNPLTLLFLGTVFFFGFIAPVELTRGGGGMSPSAAAVQITSNPVEVVERLVLRSQSTSMVNAFAVVVKEIEVNRTISFRQGTSTAAETILQPIPRQIWTSKPEPIRSVVIEHRWGMANGRCAGLCPTFSALAAFYSDFGIPGVAIGGLGLGIFMRVISEWLGYYRTNFIAQAVFATTITIPFFIWWGNLGSLVVYFGTGAVPLLLLGVVAGKPGAQRQRNRRETRYN